MWPFSKIIGAAKPDASKLAYDAATTSRRSSGWRVVSTDADTEIANAGNRLRDVARDMVRNNPHAARAVQVISEGIVGAGIIPNVVSDDDGYRSRLEDRIKAHCDTTDIDADGRHTLYGLQTLMARAIPESGEGLIRIRARQAADGLSLPFQLQALEIDHLNGSINGPMPNGNFAFSGIEFNGIGKRVAYHLFREHPGSAASWRLPDTVRVPAEYVIHVFRVDRPGQRRGVTWFAPVVVPMRDFADYRDAQLVRQKVAASFAVFIKSSGAKLASLTGEKSATNLPIESVEPGMIERLADGEDVSFGVPPTVDGYRDYAVATMHDIAVGLGVDYASLTGDGSQVNFASGRMGWLRFNRSIESWQWNMLIPGMCDPIGAAILRANAAIDRPRRARILWTPPRREMFDPSADIRASREAIAAGLSSRPFEQRKLGFDPDDLDAEIADSNQRADRLGLVFTSDGRIEARRLAGKEKP